MSDFGELCPLFNTGVFNEMVFPNIGMTGISTTMNALIGTVVASSVGDFTFGRTVVVTAAWIRKIKESDDQTVGQLKHHSSKLAAGTVFGSLVISATVTGMEVGHGYVPMVVVAATFTSAAVLSYVHATSTTDSAGTIDLIIRYREK